MTHTVPDTVRDALAAGLHPLKTWRHTQRFCQAELSKDHAASIICDHG
ncbi:hypothetical protein BN2476_610013 [Paraburkholderia piptadeniae]|uniref:Uncharacterized protein n=1 Tax=Paraburkholderia piptadeniae TaxID=1701573 RepID=A0A1N7SKI9_9BURK|nr:hypothetical protein BN2476_610013 [Paraburkholderia piptadeniae]